MKTNKLHAVLAGFGLATLVAGSALAGAPATPTVDKDNGALRGCGGAGGCGKGKCGAKKDEKKKEDKKDDKKGGDKKCGN